MDEKPHVPNLGHGGGDAFGALFIQNPLPMWIYELQTLRFLDVNEAAIAKYGYTRDEFLAMRITDIRPSEDVSRLLADLQQPRPSLQSSGDWRHRLKDGRVIAVEISSHTLEFRGQRAALVVVHDITDRKRAEEEVTAQLEIIAELGRHLDLNVLLDRVVERAAGLLGAAGGFAYLYDATRRDLEVVKVRGVPMEVGTRLAIGEGLAGLVAETREAHTVENYATWPRRARQYAEVPAAAVAGAPMLFGGVLVGVLGVTDLGPSTRVFTPDDVRLLSLFAGHAASAVHTAQLIAQRERRLRRLHALRTIDLAITASVDLRVTLNIFLDQVTAQLQVDAADILLLNPHSRLLAHAAGRGFRTDAIARSPLRLGQDLAGRAALERRVLGATDLRDAGSHSERTPLLIGEGFAAAYAAPLIVKGEVRGVLEVFHRTPLAADAEWVEFLDALAGQAAIAVDNATLFANLNRSSVDLVLAYDSTLEGWSRALDLRDRETEGHTVRVTEVTVQLARAMGMPEDDIVHIRRGALLHDIGKMGIPDVILQKPAPLTEDEWAIMRRHPVYAYELLLPISYLKPALDIPYCHHERWDGRGYPRGLQGEQIPLAARIFTVVDVWDALRSARPYRAAWPEDQVLAYLRERAGVEFDPQVVDMFVNLDVATP